MLRDRQSVTPTFWRAPTDNDYGAFIQQRLAVWRQPQMKLQKVEVKTDGAVATFEMPDVKATLTMTYTLKTDGQVVVRQQLTTTKDAEVAPMFRYGMQLQMPKEYAQVEYYGRGPIENYIDRNSSEFIGVYQNSVADEYFPYIRPQESGNHTDVRWFRVKDAEGRGLEFYASAPIEVSALNFSVADLDDGPSKDKVWGRHSGDLVPEPFTQVLIQQRQMGLGCVNAWGAWPRKEYLVPYQDYDFTFAIRPLQTK
jgi:beta-galactosidase